MRAATIHAEVLAGFDEKEAVIAPGLWYSADGDGATLRFVVEPGVGIIGKLAVDYVERVLSAVNSQKAAIDLARLVATAHPPHDPGWRTIPGICFGCHTAWPCREYRAAAAFAGVDLAPTRPAVPVVPSDVGDGQ